MFFPGQDERVLVPIEGVWVEGTVTCVYGSDEVEVMLADEDLGDDGFWNGHPDDVKEA